MEIPKELVAEWLSKAQMADNLISHLQKKCKNPAMLDSELVPPRRQTALRLAIHSMKATLKG